MKKRSLSQELFRAYIGWFILFITILLCVSMGLIGFFIKKDIEDTQKQLMNNIDENVQNYFEEMNAFSIDLLNSKEFKEIAARQLPEEYESGKSTASSFAKLYQIAYKIVQKKYNVGIVVSGDYYIWMGSQYSIHRIGNTKIDTYDNLVRNERPVVKYLGINEYLQCSSDDLFGKDDVYVTLSRSMDLTKLYVNGRDILEIQIKAEDFANDIRKLSGDDGTVRINIFDSEGNCLYKESPFDLSKYLNEGEEHGKKDQKLINICKVFDDNLTIVYTRNGIGYNNILYVFWIIAIIVAALYIVAVLWTTYRVSKQISKPIYRIYEQVGNIDLKEKKSFQGIETNIYELQFLSDAIKDMSEELQESLQQIITLKEYELHAQMLALQAQMQPHFLFNTLMNIASLADSEGNERIYRICMNLTKMFRYISIDNLEGVCMYEEIRHVENYVEIMKERFPESQVDIDIPLELMSVSVPKLTIQPLVENAFKYCNRQKPEIKVKGVVEDDGSWIVEVSDNGSGFSYEKKMEIMKKCEESLKSEKILSNQIDGMGLVNVFVRMQLFYGKENLVYLIEENQGKVAIGRRNGENGC